jgi:DNA-directed RNA polymerase delta subunit
MLIRYSICLSNVIDRFAKEHHDHTCKAGKGGSTILCDVPPAPPLDQKEDHPAVDYWYREEYNRAEATQNGETNGDAATVPPAGQSPHYYLQHHDGTPASKREIAALSFAARARWATLMEQGRAPKTFSKMSSSSWEYFSRTLLADPDYAFLRWCDDGEWKLREWSTQAYSSWTLTSGLREKKPKPHKPKTEAKAEADNNIDKLDNPDLLRMQDSEDEDRVDGNAEEDSENAVNDANHGPDESSDGVDKGNSPPQMQVVREPSIPLSAMYIITCPGITSTRSPYLVIQGSVVMYLIHHPA